ncbi:hypothetical protein [Mycobacterium sp. OAE908]|uniref:hypothetical protein n=1 Tax=Mycobacterium sp. OAE908 TaxID=2817899 RepID=UPI001AE731FF
MNRVSEQQAPAVWQRLNQPCGSPLMLAGFSAGILSSCTYWFLYYWLFAPVGPIAIAAVLGLAAQSRRYRRPLKHLAHGALLAWLFSAVFVIAAATVAFD